MPHKFNADRRAKIPKQKRRVTNCAEYDESLRRRGDLTVWISEDALAVWSAPPRTTPGGQPVYSDLAIEMCLTLRMVFKHAFCHTRPWIPVTFSGVGTRIVQRCAASAPKHGSGQAVSSLHPTMMCASFSSSTGHDPVLPF